MHELGFCLIKFTKRAVD